jgi:hypothetical protein
MFYYAGGFLVFKDFSSCQRDYLVIKIDL